MTYIEYIKSYTGTPTSAEVNEAIGYMVDKAEQLKLMERVSVFHPAFLEFLGTGDITDLAPNGLMGATNYEATKCHVFCDIEHVSGRTIMGRYMSGKHFTGIIRPDADFALERGPCVVIHQDNQIKGWIQLTKQELFTLGGVFNSVASKSKGLK